MNTFKIRRLILEELRSKYGPCDNPKDVTPHVMQDMLYLIDYYFYHHSIQQNLTKYINFIPNMNGVPDNDIYNYVGYINNDNEINLHLDVYYVADALKRKRGKSESGGLLCYRLLDCLIITMEHESLHLLEFLGLGEYHGHDKKFSQELKKIFGHTSINHRH